METEKTGSQVVAQIPALRIQFTEFETLHEHAHKESTQYTVSVWMHGTHLFRRFTCFSQVSPRLASLVQKLGKPDEFYLL